MRHYKQIIINLHVDDECDDEKIEKLAEEVAEFVVEKSVNEITEISEITTRVN